MDINICQQYCLINDVVSFAINNDVKEEKSIVDGILNIIPKQSFI